MDPEALETYIATEWPELVAETGMDPQVVISSVTAVYDANAGLAAEWATPLVDYFVLRRALRAFAVDFDVTIDGNSYRLSQRKQIADLFDQAAARVAWLVSPLDDDIGQVVTVTHAFTDAEGETW